MKAVIEFILAIIHIIFGIIAIRNNSLIIAFISILFLIAALKIADYDIYIRRDYENSKTTKI